MNIRILLLQKWLLAMAACLLAGLASSAQSMDSSLLAGLNWRSIGPYRGGRTRSAAGSASRPNILYFGAVDGGVWRTDDYGRTWKPLFDKESSGSIGALAESASDPDILYVGSGEGLHRPDLSTGNGIYKSSDGGDTWTHLGLRDGQQIPSIAIDTHDPNRLFVAVLGHPYGPNTERGVYRSTDGGAHFEKVLFIDENTGADEVVIDPDHPSTVYATLWKSQEGPWENGAWDGYGGIFKSTDGGSTWNKIGKGLPTDGDSLIQINLALAASQTTRLYASVASDHTVGIFRSDDAGANWYRITNDPLPADRIGGGDLPVMAVDPKNPDIVYSTSIVLYRSLDGGKTWTGIRGAPGGDDYQNIWINPEYPQIMLVVSDQGAIVTVNNAETWSSWYNQPTAQLYHVAADNQFPYHLYSGQQESGSVDIASRGNDGQITDRDWHPVGAEEYGYIAPDPLDPNIVYGGKMTRFDKRTGQVQEVSPVPTRGGKYRFLRTAPLLFSPVDPHTLYFAGNVLFKTRDGGHSWQVISPDLTRATWDIPASVGIYRTPQMQHMPLRGVIYTVAPSPLDIGMIWAGTDDGLIQLTRDGGKSWTNTTPAQISSWNKISLIEAGHFDKLTAYAAVNCIRLDDLHPYIYRTHDGGKSWQLIVNGLPDDPVNAVREDPTRKGLLFASTETAVYVSFDDGDLWQSLRLNMPASSVRDIMIKENDLVAATHGRGFWILDDITPLRQIGTMGSSMKTVLYQPEDAVRVKWDMNTDTPLPPDEPAGQNPPNGAILDYYLSDSSLAPVSLEIRDASGKLIRHYSSQDTLAFEPRVNVPFYWIKPQQILSAAAGAHRFLWDLHEQPLNLFTGYSMGAIYQNTVPSPSSPWVLPGTYSVTLTVNGKSYSHPIKVKMDPRVKTAAADLRQQYDLSEWCYQSRQQSLIILRELQNLHQQIDHEMSVASGSLSDTLKSLDRMEVVLENGQRGGKPGFARIDGILGRLFGQLQAADEPVTEQAMSDTKDAMSAYALLLNSWIQFKDKKWAETNTLLKQAGLPELAVPQSNP